MVDDVIGMAGTNHGTTQADRTCGNGQECTAANWQQASKSNFIEALNSRAQTFKGISYTEIYTLNDEVVTPQPGASNVAGPGKITNVATQDVCPNDTQEHLGIGTFSATAAALALDALRHSGPARPNRIDKVSTCTKRFQDGIDEATFGADVAAALQQLETSGGPEFAQEPRLRCYVFKDAKACRKSRPPR
jgi:triacylglycerol esterase/lipase EstA (alpha/beta hydrolase family)